MVHNNKEIKRDEEENKNKKNKKIKRPYAEGDIIKRRSLDK